MQKDNHSSPRNPARTARRPLTEERAKKRLELRRSASDVYRRAILDAAESVFAESSFVEAKIADIAREAGMATGTLYNYFKNKEQVFQSLLEVRGEELVADVEAVFRDEAEPLARIEALIRVCLAHVEEHRGVFILVTQMGPFGEWQLKNLAGEGAERRQERALRLFERAVRDAVVADVLRRDVHATDLVTFLVGSMKEYIRAWMAAGGRKGLSAKAPTILDVFVRGAAVRR